MMKKICLALTLLLALNLAVPSFAAPVQDEPPEVSASAPQEAPAQENTAPLPVENGSAPANDQMELPAASEEIPFEQTSVPAEQEELSATPEEIPVARASTSPVIRVVVPRTGRFILNPYGLSLELVSEITTDQIACDPMYIVNVSAVPVSVSVSTLGQVADGSSVVYATTPPSLSTREKAVFLYAEFQNEDGVWEDRYTEAPNQILISSRNSAPKTVMELDAEEGEGVFRLFGATAKGPADPWCADDKVTIVFSFTFAALETSSVSELNAENMILDAPAADDTNMDSSMAPETPAAPEESLEVDPVMPSTPKEDPDVDSKIPVTEENPEVEETPATEELPTVEEPPATDETPSTEEPPVADETPSAEEPPVADETPSAEEPPATDETPSAEEPPVADEIPSAEEPPATDETPSAEEPPVADETPSTEEPPATDETPSTEEPPVTEEPPETGAKGDASLSACPFLLRPPANAQSLAA